MAKKSTTNRRASIASIELNHQQVRIRDEISRRNRVETSRLLPEHRITEMYGNLSQGSFSDILNTTMGGISRPITMEDLIQFERKRHSLESKYKEGVTADFIINKSRAIDRSRASHEIPWAQPVASRFLPRNNSLVVSFVTAASGKYREAKHYVNVEFTAYGAITKHLINPDPKAQAESDAVQLKKSLLKFDCDCGRHTFWYRYIASIGGFAYVGTNPLARKETAYPKIRNPNLHGVACKHVLRVMQTIQKNAGFHQFLIKAILNQYKAKDKTKAIKTQTTKRQMERHITQMKIENGGILSEAEKKIAPALLVRYRQALSNPTPTRFGKDRKNARQKLNVLATLHDVEKYKG